MMRIRDRLRAVFAMLFTFSTSGLVRISIVKASLEPCNLQHERGTEDRPHGHEGVLLIMRQQAARSLPRSAADTNVADGSISASGIRRDAPYPASSSSGRTNFDGRSSIQKSLEIRHIWAFA